MRESLPIIILQALPVWESKTITKLLFQSDVEGGDHGEKSEGGKEKSSGWQGKDGYYFTSLKPISDRENSSSSKKL